MRFVISMLLLVLVGCTGSSEPRIAGAQDLAIKRVAASLTMHNALHSQEQSAYRMAKEKERDTLFAQSVNEAKAAAEADSAITKAQLVDEILKRVSRRDQNTTQIVATVGLMQKAQDEANKPAKDAAELLGIVLQFERTDGFSYTEMINTLSPLVPTPIPGK